MERHFRLIDKPTFFGALGLLFSVVIPLAICRRKAQSGLQSPKHL